MSSTFTGLYIHPLYIYIYPDRSIGHNLTSILPEKENTFIAGDKGMVLGWIFSVRTMNMPPIVDKPATQPRTTLVEAII